MYAARITHRAGYWLLLLGLAFLPAAARAGWVITETLSSGKEILENKTVYFQDLMVKFVSRDQTLLFNLASGDLTFIFPSTKLFWHGNLRNFREETISAVKQEIEEQLASLPEDKRLDYRKSIMHYLADLEKIPGRDTLSRNMNIRLMKGKKQEKVLGYDTWKYSFYFGDKLARQLWIPVKPVIRADFTAFARLSSALTFDAPSPNIDQSPEYFSVLSSGYPVKTTEFTENGTIVWKVNSLSQADLPASEFQVPAGFSRTTIFAIRQGKAFREAEIKIPE